MNRILLSVGALLLSIIVIMSNVQVSDSVLSNKMIVTVKAEKDPITEGGFPAIIGTVKDQGYKSVSNANVLIAFGSVIVTTTTDAQGNYRYQSVTPFTQGVYEVDVTASKIGYVKGLASTTFTVKPNVVSTTPKTLSGLPIQVGNYTVFLGKVAQWNLETTCFVNFADKHMRFLKTCDLFSWAPDDFNTDQPMMSMVSVLQYHGIYKLFPKQVYVTAAGMVNDTSLKKFVSDTWAS